jgi:hypothetical protein
MSMRWKSEPCMCPSRSLIITAWGQVHAQSMLYVAGCVPHLKHIATTLPVGQ